MLTNLQEATQEYWHKLDELETAYQQGKISLEEVDVEAASLMAELGRKRRVTISYFLQSSQLMKSILLNLSFNCVFVH
jgi:hypothetical protein